MPFIKGIKIDKDFILSHISEEDIFEKYFRPVVYKQNIRNNIRNDYNPGCRFYIHKKTGRIRFKDFSHGYNWDCFAAAQKKTGLSFIATLKQIAEDFKLIEVKGNKKRLNKNLPNPSIKFEDRKVEINKVLKKQIVLVNKRLNYTWNERKYWKQYFICDKTLQKFYVYGFDKAFLIKTFIDGSTKKTPLLNSRKELKFAYYLGTGEWKLYYPERKKSQTKFIQLRGDIIQGWYLLPDREERIVFTKSYKDIMALNVINNIPAISTQSENIIIPKDIMKEIKSRFKNIYIFYDNDMAGMRGMIKNMIEYPFLKPLLFPKGEPKDVSDVIKKYGLLKIQEILIPLIQ